MGYITQILLICVCINIITVYGNTRNVRPIQRSQITGLLSRHRHLRFNPTFRARLRRRGLTLARRFQSLSNRLSALRGLGSSQPSLSRRKSSGLGRGTTANLIARLRHPLLCGKGKVLVCGEAKNGITIQRCYSNCGRRSCIVPCVCTCFDLPKAGFLRPAGGSVFLPLAERSRIPGCRTKEILRCTAKQRTIATNKHCSSACMSGVCPATCNCFCIDQRLKGQGLESKSSLGSANIISDKSRDLGIKTEVGGLTDNVGGAIIVEGSPSSGGSTDAATETETIDVKIDVVKGGDTGKKGSEKKGDKKGRGDGDILDPNLGINLGGPPLGGSALGGNALDGNTLGGNALGGNALGGPLDGIGGIPGVNSLGNNDPLVLLDPTRQDQTVGKIPFNPNDPIAPSGLSPGNNQMGSINPQGGEFLSQALQNLGGSVDLLDPSLANMLPMAFGQGGADGSAAGGASLNAMGQNNVGSNDVSGFNTAAVSDVGGVSVGAINDALNAAGVNSISGLDSTGLKGMPMDPGLANGMGGLDVSGVQIAAGIDPGVTKIAGGNVLDNVATNMISGSNTGSPSDLWGTQQGGSTGQQTGSLNDVWGSNSGTGGKTVSPNTGLDGAWGGNSGTGNSNKKVSVNVNVSGSGPPPAITSGQNNDYCSQTGRRMWCKAGTTWESTPGLTRWCNVNCPSGACDVERCLCNCVSPQEYELNFNKFIGFK